MLQKLTEILGIIAPVFCLAGIGCFIKWRMGLDRRTISTAVLYIFVPCFIFSRLSVMQISAGEVFRILVCFVAYFAAVWLVTLTTSKLLKSSQAATSGLMMSTLFMNAINYGFPVTLFAFGEKGVELAVVFALGASLAQNTIAVYFASRAKKSIWGAWLTVFRMPMVYALLAAVVVRCFHTPIPTFITNTVNIAAGGAIPATLVLLGVQLASTQITMQPLVGVAACIRLVAAPLLAFGLTTLLGVTGLAQKVFILESGMPTAVNMSAIAIQLDAEAGFVTNSVFYTTILSILTVSAILWFIT